MLRKWITPPNYHHYRDGAVILSPQKGDDYIIAAITIFQHICLPYVSISMSRLNCDQQRFIK